MKQKRRKQDSGEKALASVYFSVLDLEYRDWEFEPTEEMLLLDVWPKWVRPSQPDIEVTPDEKRFLDEFWSEIFRKRFPDNVVQPPDLRSVNRYVRVLGGMHVSCSGGTGYRILERLLDCLFLTSFWNLKLLTGEFSVLASLLTSEDRWLGHRLESDFVSWLGSGPELHDTVISAASAFESAVLSGDLPALAGELAKIVAPSKYWTLGEFWAEVLEDLERLRANVLTELGD